MKSVIVALGRVDWEAEFVSAVSHPMVGVRLHRRCVDGVDVRAAVQLAQIDFVVISDSTLRVDRDFVTELEQAGSHLVVITEQAHRWIDLGVSSVINFQHRNPIRAVSEFSELLSSSTETEIYASGNSVPPAQVQSHAVSPKKISTAGGGLSVQQGSTPNYVVAVLGFAGGSGRTTCMRELSWRFAQSSHSTLMVEADTFTPALAIELGLDPKAPTLGDIVHSSELQKLSDASLKSQVTQLHQNLDVIPSLTRASQWSELRVNQLRKFWNLLADTYSRVIVDLGPILEHEDLDPSGLSLAHRNGASLTALERADKVVICVRNTDVAVSRFVRNYIEVSDLMSEKDCRIVLWGERSGQVEGLNAIRHYCDVSDIRFIAMDSKISQRAIKENLTMSAVAPKSETAKFFQDLAVSLDSDMRLERTQSRISRLVSRSTQRQVA